MASSHFREVFLQYKVYSQGQTPFRSVQSDRLKGVHPMHSCRESRRLGLKNLEGNKPTAFLRVTKFNTLNNVAK